MKHYDDDILLKSVLQLLDDGEETEVRGHLSQCQDCSRRLEILKAETGVIGGFVPHVAPNVPPLPQAKRISFAPLLKVAAILVIGFLAGYLTSEWTRPDPVNVVPQNLTTNAQSAPVSDFTTCEQIDIRIGFN